jgi:hypothetical protein
MNEKKRIYYYFIFGAGGGTTGWFLAATLLQGSRDAGQTLGQQAAFGALLGALIGLAIAAYDGLTSRSLIRFAKFGGIGLTLGAFAGVVALPAASWIYSSTVGPAAASRAAASPASTAWQSALIGTLCWLLFGGLIGLGETLSRGAQSFKGLLGGVLGGLIGGGVYEIARASGVAQTASFEQQRVLAIALGVLGGAIGSSIAFVTTALKSAWFEVVDGKFAGKIYDVTKYVDRKLGSHKAGIIGSDEWSASVYLPPSREVLPRHAQVGFANGAPTLTFFPEAEGFQSSLVNGRRASVWQLRNGDRVQIGSTTLIYHHKRK